MGIMCSKCGDAGGPWTYVEGQGFICEDCLGGGVKVQQKYEKPPLGLRPRIIWLNEREMELLEAMERYEKAGKEIPEMWGMELAWITAQMALEGSKI